jgi:hypothetical protein
MSNLVFTVKSSTGSTDSLADRLLTESTPHIRGPGGVAAHALSCALPYALEFGRQYV